jgi:Uma2 family endonuclease
MVATLSPMAPAVRYTVDDLAAFPDDGKHRELSDGRVVEWEVTTAQHAWLLVVLGGLLDTFAFEHQLGMAMGGDPLVRILGSRFSARGPDVAFYARQRLPSDLTAATMAEAPDFVIEIISPTDRAGEVQEKVRDWLRAGVRLLWYINPETGTTVVYHAGTIAYVDQDDVLDGRDVLPGFTLVLRDLFARLTSIQSAPEGRSE